MSSPIIVGDAGSLIALAKLDQLSLLSTLFSEIHVPDTVCLEVTVDAHRPDVHLLNSFLNNSVQRHADCENAFVHALDSLLDAGEIQALALAKQLQCGVLMDELRGRKVAGYHHISVVGVLGVFMQAKQQGAIPQVKPLIEQLERTNYRLSHALVKAVLERMGES